MKYSFLFLTSFLVLALGLAWIRFTTAQTESAPRESEGGRVTEQPVELGLVNWGRDLDRAVAQSIATDKPLAILFQEVPG